jgi:hypothetical protein
VTSFLPTSIRKRDGRLVPFEPEKISRSLFAAAESMGAPDPFLARELTDSVIHFLTVENDRGLYTTEHIADLVAKVVRELGHPALAKAYDDHLRRQRAAKKKTAACDNPDEQSSTTADPFTILSSSAAVELSRISLTKAYPRDLASAHREGLLRLMDLAYPNEMAGLVLSPNKPLPLDGWELLDELIQARSLAGSFVSFDGPEHAIAAREGIPEEMASRFIEMLDRSLWLTQLHGILNLNAADAPAWAAPLSLGPLFQEFQKEMENERLDRIALYLLRHARKQTIYWHVSERDFREEAVPRLHEIVGRSLARSGVEFVFDRPNQSITLGPGIDRLNPAALGIAAINLSRFVDHLGGGPLSPDIYLQKLRSLARFAKTAGHARQDYLRQRGRAQIREGFLLERAVHVVLLIGTLEAAAKVAGAQGSLEPIAELACRSCETIRLALETDHPRTLATRIDFVQGVNEAGEDNAEFRLLPRQQLKLASGLQRVAAGGCSTIILNRSDSAIVKEATELLRLAWRGGIDRLRFA